MVDNRRRNGKVDKLPPKLKSTVEQMLLTGAPYREVVAYLKDNGEIMSAMAVHTFAKKFLATVEMITVAQNNFAMLMEEMNKFPDLDPSEALLRLASHHVLNALSNMEPDGLSDIPVDKLIRETSGLVRAAAHKKRVDIQTQESFETGLDAFKALVFETMAKENPELYKNVSEFLSDKKKAGSMNGG